MLKSEHLRYEEMQAADFDFFYQLHSNPQVMYYAYLDVFNEEEKAREWFDHILNTPETIMFVVYEKTTNTPIGVVDYLTEHLEEDQVEIGYFLLPDFWGKSYGYEMAAWMIEYLFDHTSYHEIIASCHGDNIKSETLMKKLGMSFVSRNIGARFKHGLYVDELKYVLLRK